MSDMKNQAEGEILKGLHGLPADTIRAALQVQFASAKALRSKVRMQDRMIHEYLNVIYFLEQCKKSPLTALGDEDEHCQKLQSHINSISCSKQHYQIVLRTMDIRYRVLRGYMTRQGIQWVDDKRESDPGRSRKNLLWEYTDEDDVPQNDMIPDSPSEAEDEE